jgi:hypothetical protein
MGLVTRDNVNDVFTYHPPKGDWQIERYHLLRQAAKECVLVILDDPDPDARKNAIGKFSRVLEANTGDCRDRAEALGCLAAGTAFVGAAALASADERSDVEGRLVQATAQEEATQAIVAAVRAALMWANASIALGAQI